MRPPIKQQSQSEAYRKKASGRKLIWYLILVFILYSIYAVGKPLIVMWLFENATADICEEKSLSNKDIDFAPIVAEIRTAADGYADHGLVLSPDAITYRTEGGINHIAIKFTTVGSWCGVEIKYEDWETKYMSQKKRMGY